MTEATQQALIGLRDLSTIKWYAIPLLAIVFYIYTKEIKDARRTGDWNAILAGLTVFGADFFNETWNGWVMHLTQRSAFWTTPGDTALRVTVGWNIEIIFMFIECVLNVGGQLVWEYPFWYLSFKGVWLILLIGYFQFFFYALIVISLKSMKAKLTMVGIIYAVPVIMNVLALGFWDWRY